MQQRLAYLDSSRGLASLSVLLGHFFGAYGLFSFLLPFENSSLHLFWHGEGAVTYFFVLSGYVLSIGYFRKAGKETNINIIGYLVKRLLRIFPLFVFAAAVSFFLLRYYIHIPQPLTSPARTDWILGLWNRELSAHEAFRQALLLVNIPEVTPKLLPQGWTLTLEMICSSIIPIALILLKTGKAIFALFFIYIYFTGNWSFFAFALGILLAYYTPQITALFSRLHPVFILLTFFAAVIFYVSPYNFLKGFAERFPTLRFKLQCIGAVLFIICLISSRAIQGFLSKKIFLFLGRISYGIYVTHFFILIPVVPVFIKYLNDHGQTNENAVRLFALLLLLALTVIVSYILNKLLEEPFITLSKKIVNRFFTSHKPLTIAGSH